MHGTYIGNGRMLVDTTFGAKLLAAADDLSLMPDLVIHGGYDRPLTNWLRRHLWGGQVAIDVGANIGLFSLLMAWQVGPGGRVLAYECEPRNLALLRENVAMNYAGWVEVSDHAVGAARGEMTLYRTTRFQGNSSLVPHDDAYVERFRGIDEQQSLRVPVRPLDELSGRFERIHFVKIDVEGAELLVLQGMRRLLASGTVDRLSVEIQQERAPGDWDALVRELTGLDAAGWRFATIDDDGDTDPLSLGELVERGAFSQVLMERPGL